MPFFLLPSPLAAFAAEAEAVAEAAELFPDDFEAAGSLLQQKLKIYPSKISNESQVTKFHTSTAI